MRTLFIFTISSSAIAASGNVGRQKQVAAAMCCYGMFISRPQRLRNCHFDQRKKSLVSVESQISPRPSSK